jgi:hypothetical protein
MERILRLNSSLDDINPDAFTITNTGKVHRDLLDLLKSDNAQNQLKALKKIRRNKNRQKNK